ncbi:MAG: hypothetical protein HYT80_09080 [Euryarchaeota archaeon]|nr:hypothetical protein [Euryarchaeota archaeon]
MLQPVSAALLQILPMQDEVAPPEGVEIPIFPLIVAGGGIIAIVLIAMGALRLPRIRFPERAPAKKTLRPIRPEVVVEQPLPAPAPVYKKAPVTVVFPMVRPQFPDVWGVAEKAIVVFRVEDRALMTQREIQGLTASIGGAEVPLVFYKGEARIERTFPEPREVPIVVDLKVKGERQVRRTTRLLRVVRYREEIADLFAEFKDEVSRTITPLRPDATPWEIHDAILDVNNKVSQIALREIVSSFEEAKFSNHPVGRPTYEKMVLALRALKPSGG